MEQQERIVYKLPELNEILGVSVRTLREYIKRGELRALKIGRNYLVRPKDLDDFLEANIVTPAKEISLEMCEEAVSVKLPDRPKLITEGKAPRKRKKSKKKGAENHGRGNRKPND